MARAIKLSDEFVEIARDEGRIMHRSIGAQVEYWARIGRQVEASGALGVEGVRRLLSGQGSVQDLREADDALYTRELIGELQSLDGSDQRLLDDLRAGGHPIVSADEQGELVIEKPRKRPRTATRR